MLRFVFASDSHRSVDLCAQFASVVTERLRQGRNIRWPSLGLFEQRGDKAIASRSRHQHQMPGLDVRVGWRKLREGKSLPHQFRWNPLRQKHAHRMARSDRFVKVQHNRSKAIRPAFP